MKQRSDGVAERRSGEAWAVRVVGLIAVLAAVPARADIDPGSGIDFVRVGAPGNAPYQSAVYPQLLVNGHGEVDYTFSIAKFETLTSEWVAFMNAAYDRPAGDRIPHLIPPARWGAVPTTPNNPGGQRWTVPAGNERRMVGTIDWRMAAIYCNFLHNGGPGSGGGGLVPRQNFLSGAYDVSTFGYTGPRGDIFTDQATHSPGARYWVPTWNEWLKASHFDPNKNGPGQSGWWEYSTRSDTSPVYGPPGAVINGQLAQANAGFTLPNRGEERILLGSYLNAPSPWGLFDVAGGLSEWTEGIYLTGNPRRIFDGTDIDSGVPPPGSPFRSNDWIGFEGSDFPSVSIPSYGFRIASSVPAPSSLPALLGLGFLFGSRRRNPGASHVTLHSANRLDR